MSEIIGEWKESKKRVLVWHKKSYFAPGVGRLN